MKPRSNQVMTPPEDIDLGLAICGALTKPGERRTLAEIARFCGCRTGTIWMIENRALHKLRKKMAYGHAEFLEEMRD